MERTRKVWARILQILTVTMLFSMLTGGMTVMAAGTAVVNMQKSGEAYIYEGYWDDYTTTVYHKIKISKSGFFGIAASGGGFDGNLKSMKVTLCNSKKKSLERTSAGSTVNLQPMKAAYYGVTKGTYYIKVQGVPLYSIVAAFQPYTDKGASSKGKAYTLKKGKTVYGVMPAGESATKADWYKFKITQKKVLSLSIAAEGNGQFRFYLYGPGYKNGVKITSMMNKSGTFYSCVKGTSRTTKLSKGTYYIKVVRGSASKYKRSSGIYSLKWTLK